MGSLSLSLTAASPDELYAKLDVSLCFFAHAFVEWVLQYVQLMDVFALK